MLIYLGSLKMRITCKIERIRLARFAALDGCAAPLSWKLASKFWPGDFWKLIPDGDC
jgi:hypothetical protein